MSKDTTIYAKIPTDLHTFLKAYSFEYKISVKEIISTAIIEYLQEKIKAKEEQGDTKFSSGQWVLNKLINDIKGREEKEEERVKQKIIDKDQERKRKEDEERRERARQANLTTIQQIEAKGKLSYADEILLKGLIHKCQVCGKEYFPRERCVCENGPTPKPKRRQG